MTQIEAPAVGGRVHEVDAIRGLALAGILIANIGYFADPGSSIGGNGPVPDDPVTFLISTLVLTKFYVIFSFLFGYSFTLQMRSAERAGVSVRARTLRRCLGLFAIGVLHGYLLWIGDILTLYAVLGLLLLAMRGFSPRKALITGTAIIGVTSLIWLELAGLLSRFPVRGGAPATDPDAVARVLALATGSPLDVLTLQAELYPPMANFVWIVQGPTAVALFLFGLAAGKSKLLEKPDGWAHLLPRIQWIGFGVGLPAAVFFTWASTQGSAMSVVATAVNNVTSLPLAAAYVATLLRLVRRYPVIGGALTPAGRVAASNYVGQSLLAALVFTGYGLGLAGQVSPLGTLAVAAAIYTLLLLLSAWWLRNHRYGPIEYGLRRLTNWN